MEERFQLRYYGKLSGSEIDDMPLKEKSWYMNRLIEQCRKEKEAYNRQK